jgi:ligand-binding sensor domain-containing protein
VEMFSVHRSANGAVWAGTVSGGVSVLGASGFKTYSSANGLLSNAVNSITESRDGTIWMAAPFGLDEFHGSKWISWTINNGLPSADVRADASHLDAKPDSSRKVILLWRARKGGVCPIHYSN